VTERDKLGRIVQRDETVQGVTTHYEYAYDLAGRLTDVWTDALLTAHYEFDANGNRLSKTENMHAKLIH
jgi:YD repeat-containing protein